MKKILVVMLFSVLMISPAQADTGLTDQDLETLHQKVVRMRREMDRFMKEVVGPYADVDKSSAGIFGQDVRIDVVESDKDVMVKADLPGMAKDKIDITLADNKMLKISGSREIMTKEERPGMIRQERMSGHFERSIELPAECESGGIKATYNAGVLEIMLPKKKGVKEETIKVSVQ